VSLPPLNEQRRIVCEIEKQFSRLDAGIAALNRGKANLKGYRTSVLNAAYRGDLVPKEVELDSAAETGEQLLKRIRFERPKDSVTRRPLEHISESSELREIPNGWSWASADELTDVRRPITYGVIKLGEHVPGGVPVLRSSDVRHLRLDLSNVKTIRPEIAKTFRRTFLQGNEVLVTVRGTLGGVAVAPTTCRDYNISREVAMLVPNEPTMAKMLAILIAAPPLQQWLLKRSKGIAYTGINIETLKQLPIPVPPLREQHRIVEEVERRLSVIEEVEQVIESNLWRARNLREAILQRAFSGKL